MTGNSTTIRFGGEKIDGRFFFELSGGALALDFVNTRDKRPDGGLERLVSYDRLLDWARQIRLADEAKVARVRKLAAAHPRGAEHALALATTLREAMFVTLKRSMAGQPPTSGQLHELNRWIGVGFQGRRLMGRKGGLKWQAYSDLDRLDFMLPAAVESLAEILGDDALRDRIKLCAAQDCDRAFLDQTRRRNRLWCDMSVCGNRAKARRHYVRERKQWQDHPGELSLAASVRWAAFIGFTGTRPS